MEMKKKKNLSKLNFACGRDIKNDHVNMDVAPLKGVDVVHDFNRIPYPFPANSFTEIYANHAMEHVDDLVKVMEEFQRILKPGGKVFVMTPYFASPNSHRDPTHKIWFTSTTFSYFHPIHYYSKAKFLVLRRKIIFFSNAGFMRSRWYSWPLDLVLNALLPIYERFFCYWFPASEIHFLLEVKK